TSKKKPVLFALKSPGEDRTPPLITPACIPARISGCPPIWMTFMSRSGSSPHFFNKKAQSEIRRGAVACNPQSLASQVFLGLDRWLHIKVERRHVHHAAKGHNVGAGKISKDDIAARQGHGEFSGDYRLRHSAAPGDIDLIDKKPMLVKDSGILGKIETGLRCTDGTVGDGDAFGLRVEWSVNQGRQQQNENNKLLVHESPPP